MSKKVTGTKLGIIVIALYFTLQCTTVDAPTHQMKDDRMYFDDVRTEEVERTS